jgi:hypothetical protein
LSKFIIKTLKDMKKVLVEKKTIKINFALGQMVEKKKKKFDNNN